MTEPLDPRVTPARPDLAAAALEGRVHAAQYAEGWPMLAAAPVANLRNTPSLSARTTTQALCGETMLIFEMRDAWAWGQIVRDHYVGYIPASALSPIMAEMTHVVREKSTFVYPEPDIKAPPAMALPFGARVRVDKENGSFVHTPNGFIFAAHLAPIEECAPDFVAVAEKMIGAPYLWGGRTPAGIDCSGLTQVSLQAAGIEAPRDSDMQAAQLGAPVDLETIATDLRRGDLIFWKGHVGVMRDAETLLHANAYHMLTASEPFAVARRRILENGSGDVAAVRRLPGLSRACRNA